MTRTDPLTDLFHILVRDGFAHVPGARMQALFEAHAPLSDLTDFAASWDDLGLDTYMADGGRYRKRRFGAFAADAGAAPIRRRPHQPHYQSRDYNTLNGGIERWFPPISEAVAAGPTMQAILATCRSLFDRMAPGRAWHIEVHQFRIEARAGAAGRPTPEGMHRDGVDYVLVLLVRRENIRSGVTSIHDLDGHTLGNFTLTEPLSAALVDDHRVLHGVTPVEPEAPARPAFRDVLVVTFREQG
ncbi:MAG: 2OG-Fe dioxygenase family protein [Acetobacteraceae bacterium]